MRGRYYAKHTVNHIVENQYKIKKRNEAFKTILKTNAIEYIKKTDISIDEKVDYLKGLTHDTYRYGTKYKYECNLKSTDISSIIRSTNDDELYKAYFGRTIKEENDLNTKIGLGCGFVFVLLVLLSFALKN